MLDWYEYMYTSISNGVFSDSNGDRLGNSTISSVVREFVDFNTNSIKFLCRCTTWNVVTTMLYHNSINRFKVIGRTADVHYMKTLIDAYVQEEYNGNVADLCFHLEHVEGSGEKPEYFLENKKLDGFVDFWFQNDFRCDDVICGEECTYCDTHYGRIKEGCCH